MTTDEKKAISDLLKFAEGLWAELKSAGYCEQDGPDPWQFKQARTAITPNHPPRTTG